MLPLTHCLTLPPTWCPEMADSQTREEKQDCWSIFREANTAFLSLEIDWPTEETEAAAQTASGNRTTEHLWEESWDDDDTSDDFSAQLRYV
jgi:26 proteasome complex subunit DSS1